MTLALDLAALLLLAAFGVVVVGVWPAIRDTAKYEIRMWRIKRAVKRSGVKYPVPDVRRRK